MVVPVAQKSRRAANHLRHPGPIGNAELRAKTDSRLLRATSLSSDNDDSIGSTGSVNGCCRCILQNIYGLNVAIAYFVD